MTRQELTAKAGELSREIRKSAEYQEYLFARNAAYQTPATRVLVDKYHRLQLQAQGRMMFGGNEKDSTMEELQKLGELLQFDNAASRLLMAEYTLRELMADVYNALGSQLDMDVPSFEMEEVEAAEETEATEAETDDEIEAGEAQKEDNRCHD